MSSCELEELIFCIRLWLMDSTSALNMLYTGLWSEKRDSPRTYDSWLRPLPYHKMRSHLCKQITEFSFLTVHNLAKQFAMQQCALNYHTMQEFSSSPSDSCLPLHICQSYLSICMLAGSISSPHSTRGTRGHLFARSSAETTGISCLLIRSLLDLLAL